MDTKRNCAERMRPILQAMEESIDAARNRRTHQPSPYTANPIADRVTHPPTLVGAGGNHARLATEGHSSDEAPRVKARPKRLDNQIPMNPFPDSGYRSQAG
jgi:hypothetical protein